MRTALKTIAPKHRIHFGCSFFLIKRFNLSKAEASNLGPWFLGLLVLRVLRGKHAKSLREGVARVAYTNSSILLMQVQQERQAAHVQNILPPACMAY